MTFCSINCCDHFSKSDHLSQSDHFSKIQPTFHLRIVRTGTKTWQWQSQNIHKNVLQKADLLGMVRTEDLARTVPTNSSQPPSLWPMLWSASLSLLSFNKAFSIIIHSVFVKLGNVSYGQDFTLEAILFLMLELDSHRYGAGASLWPKKWTHEQQLSQKTTFSPIVIFSIPFLGILPTRSGYFAWTAKKFKI